MPENDRINTSLPDNSAKGSLKVSLTSSLTAAPVANAKVSISYTGIPDSTLEELMTDSSGQTESLTLDAPPLEYSLDPAFDEQPYSEYTLRIEAEGYAPISVAGAEVLASTLSLQNLALAPLGAENNDSVYVIPAHTLYGEYPAKIPEEEIKPVQESGEIVLSRVVVPEYIVVHDGSPRDSTA